MKRKVIDWLETRTGLETAVRNFLYEDIPASSGWRHVFGSVAAFLFLVQAFTGIMLAFNYAPTPGEAYNSLKFLVTQITGGRLMRGLHHWGASMMIVVVVLHMIQVFLWGAYKKPREATWMVGVVLLLIVLGFGLTGYLLPWDNRAYWGTVVTTQIAGSAPGLGQYAVRLMGAENGVGAVTFARFYAMHVLLLPPLISILIAVHVYLVRKHGVAPTPSDANVAKKKFYPEQVYKDTVAVFCAFVLLFTMASLVQVPLERIADPTDTSYIPRPEWYFLFLFQTLKFFEGSMEVVGSVVLPTLAIVALLLVPFIDRSALVRLRQRTVAMGVVAMAAVGWTALTAAAIRSTPPSPQQDVLAEQGQVAAWQQLSPEELAGIGYYRRENCASCHAPGNPLGPDLTTLNTKRDAKWMVAHFRDPQSVVPGTTMPPILLKDSQLSALAAFLIKLKPANAKQLEEAPAFATEGAIVYEENRCGICHQVNGIGMKLGPPLNGLARRRSREWVEEHFVNPQKLSPGTTMPPYKFNSKDMDRITTYLMSIPTV